MEQIDMSDPSTKEIVDEFDTGFTGSEVLRVVPVDFVDTEAVEIEPDPRADDVAAPAQADTTAADDKAFDNPDAPLDKPANVEVDVSPKTITVPADEYAQMLSTVLKLDNQLSEQSKKLDQAFGKIGGVEGFVRDMQRATPAGEVATMSDADMASLNEQFPSISKEMQTILNTALSKVKGTGQVVQTVDDNRIGEVVQQRLAEERVRIKQELQREQVLDVHPDFDEVRFKPEFKDWLEKQPPDWVAKYGNSWSPAANITVMDTYKKSKAPPPPAPNARKAAITAAVNPRGSGPAQKPGAPSDDDQFDIGYKTG